MCVAVATHVAPTLQDNFVVLGFVFAAKIVFPIASIFASRRFHEYIVFVFSRVTSCLRCGSLSFSNLPFHTLTPASNQPCPPLFPAPHSPHLFSSTAPRGFEPMTFKPAGPTRNHRPLRQVQCGVDNLHGSFAAWSPSHFLL